MASLSWFCKDLVFNDRCCVTLVSGNERCHISTGGLGWVKVGQCTSMAKDQRGWHDWTSCAGKFLSVRFWVYFLNLDYLSVG